MKKTAAFDLTLSWDRAAAAPDTTRFALPVPLGERRCVAIGCVAVTVGVAVRVGVAVSA